MPFWVKKQPMLEGSMEIINKVLMQILNKQKNINKRMRKCLTKWLFRVYFDRNYVKTKRF